MKAAVSLLSLMLLLGLDGCARHITNANLNQVKPEMNSKEVESILGPPTRTETPAEIKTQEFKVAPPTTLYVYEQDGKTVELTFVGDRLARDGIKGNFGK